MVFARVLMIVGGLGFAATAFTPAYSVIGREEVERGPYGHIEIRYRGAQTLSPWEIFWSSGDARFLSWLLLLPQLFGLTTALLHTVDAAPRMIRGLYRGIVFLGLIPIFFAGLAYTIGGLIVLLSDKSWATALGLSAAGVLLFLVFAAAVRLFMREEVSRHSPYLQLLLYQAVLTIFAAGWLLIVVLVHEKMVAAHVLGMPAVAFMMIGTHLAARRARKDMNAAGTVTAA